MHSSYFNKPKSLALTSQPGRSRRKSIAPPQLPNAEENETKAAIPDSPARNTRGRAKANVVVVSVDQPAAPENPKPISSPQLPPANTVAPPVAGPPAQVEVGSHLLVVVVVLAALWTATSCGCCKQSLPQTPSASTSLQKYTICTSIARLLMIY